MSSRNQLLFGRHWSQKQTEMLRLQQPLCYRHLQWLKLVQRPDRFLVEFAASLIQLVVVLNLAYVSRHSEGENTSNGTQCSLFKVRSYCKGHYHVLCNPTTSDPGVNGDVSVEQTQPKMPNKDVAKPRN